MDLADRPSGFAGVGARCVRLGLLALVAAAAVAAVSAAAAPLPAASTTVQCFADGNNSLASTECTQGGFPGVPPSAFASATLDPFPAVSVEVTSPPATVLGAGADATVLYYFQVTGGNVGDVVPIMIDFRLEVSSSPESTALARLRIYTTAMGASFGIGEELVCNPQTCDETEFADTVSLQALSGSTLDSITLYAMAQAPATRVSNESARAFADPFIYVDPSFPNASLYSVVVSQGVMNVPVPEPGLLWLLGSALAAFGLSSRR